MIHSSESMDNLFRALADSHRRRLLFSLLEYNPQEGISIPDDAPAGEVDHESLYVEMVHCQLPMLEDVGYIEWDRQTQQVVKGPEFKSIQPVLETLREYNEDISATS